MPEGLDSPLRPRFLLARIYRSMGRTTDAEKIENELRQQLRYATADCWMANELKRIAAASPSHPQLRSALQ